MKHFYKPDIESNFLNPEESHYAVRVLRLNKGEECIVFNGKETVQKAICINPDPNKMELRIIDTEIRKVPAYRQIHIAISPTKKMDKMEWFVEKCIEIGIGKITFLKTDHGIRNKLRIDRLNKLVLSAGRQSGNFYLPEIIALNDFKTLIDQSKESNKFIAHVDTKNELSVYDLKKTSSDFLILIGPEGDFSDNEIELAHKNGFRSLSLGKSRLRTETAGLVACVQLNYLINK